MAEIINWNFVAQVLNGPSISGAGGFNVDAYEKFDFTIAKAGTNTVALQDASKISLLIISSATPDPKITYKGGTIAAPTKLPGEPSSGYVLDAPHIFLAQIVRDLFKGITDITLTNGTGAEVEIHILIGRKIA
ncbi:MAG: hypothetical protein NTX38_19140 [Methylobacter sp.]|nr:hypothetical protein [Methylobacter sp.]